MNPATGADLAAVAATVHRRLLDAGAGPAAVPEAVTRHAPLLTRAERDDVVGRVRARFAGLGPIAPLFDDPEVSEIMLNGPGTVWVERAGRLEPTPIELDRHELELLIERIVAPIGAVIDPRRPWVDGRLADGSRFNVVTPPVAIDGPCVTVRRFVLRRQTLDAFCSPGTAARLAGLVADGHNIVVSGGTGAGKTTLLNALASRLPDRQRIITVEDAAELQLPHRHVVRLEGRRAGVEGAAAVEIRDLVRNALRMRPDRLVIGEVRGPEAFDLVQALNTGHAGCLSTIHANSAVDALRRLATLVLSAGTGLPLDAIGRQIAAAVDVVVHVERAGAGARRVAEVAEVTGPETTRAIETGAR